MGHFKKKLLIIFLLYKFISRTPTCDYGLYYNWRYFALISYYGNNFVVVHNTNRPVSAWTARTNQIATYTMIAFFYTLLDIVWNKTHMSNK